MIENKSSYTYTNKAKKAVSVARDYYQISKSNTLDSNLTELYAAESVDSGYAAHNDWAGHLMRYMYIADQMRKKQPDNVLDIGCGKMQMAYLIWKNRYPMGGKYWCVDLRMKRDWLEPIKLKTDICAIQADIVVDDLSQVPDWPGQFETVICTEVYEHVPRDKQQQLVDSLFSWTAPGGYCYLSTPNAGVSDSTADNHIDADGLSRERSYDEKIAMCVSAGFEIEESFGVFGRQDRIKPALQAMPWLVTDRAGKVIEELTMWDHPIVQNGKKFLNHSWFITLLCASFPELSNNAIFTLRRPL